MDKIFAVALGTILGFLLPMISDIIKRIRVGENYANALKMELDHAKQNIHEKMKWLSRDVENLKSTLDEKLLVKNKQTLLYLGEIEDFDLELPFWKDNLREIVEIVDSKTFNKIGSEIILIRQFLSKFMDMKQTFQIPGGDPKKMALACYKDLIEIHDKLSPCVRIDVAFSEN